MRAMPGLGTENGEGGDKGSNGNIGGRVVLRRRRTELHAGHELMHRKCSLCTYSTPELVLRNRDSRRSSQSVFSRKPQRAEGCRRQTHT